MEEKELTKQIILIAKDVGEIKGTVKAIDKRLNSEIDRINKHIQEGERYRPRIISNCKEIVSHRWLFGVIFSIFIILFWLMRILK